MSESRGVAAGYCGGRKRRAGRPKKVGCSSLIASFSFWTDGFSFEDGFGNILLFTSRISLRFMVFLSGLSYSMSERLPGQFYVLKLNFQNQVSQSFSFLFFSPLFSGNNNAPAKWRTVFQPLWGTAIPTFFFSFFSVEVLKKRFFLSFFFQFYPYTVKLDFFNL